ncbi:MAG: hypothetical protein EHM23_01440 [Acidobacteria bacterium]|nr:MAG: hypothetical protein EHM23_09645 [Acidobacteriota bacterium]RPJ63777.1 MAG: hypothetical protein EHM23_01440 [Acidobacteriota bacterium]
MPEQKKLEAALDTTVNCCNGRVGRRLLDMAVQNEVIAGLVKPTGVELIREAAGLGLAAKDTVNCCNGRVGSQMNVQELLTEFGGGGRGE